MERIVLLLVLGFLTVRPGAETLAQDASAADRERAASQFRSGQEAFRSEDFAAAEASFKAAIQTDSRLAAAHCALGQAYMSMRRYGDAVQALTACKRIALEEAQRLASGAASADRQIQERVQDLRDQIRQLEALRDATRQMDITRLEGQVDTLERQRRRAPAGAEVPAEISFALGTAHLRNGSLEDAAREYRDALQVRPSYGQAHNNLAVVYMGLGEWSKAREQVEEAEKAGFHVSPQMKKDLEAQRLTPSVASPFAPEPGTPSAVRDPAEPEKVTVDHTALACVLSSRFPRIEAQIRPAESVQRAWVRFRRNEKSDWYSVSLRKEGGHYVGLLPKPRWAKTFEYYIEALDQNAGNTHTAGFSAIVARDPKDCGESRLSPSVAEASGLIIEKAPGSSPKAKPVPPGFSGRGVVGEAGVFDIPPGKTAFIAGAIGAAVVGGVLATSDEKRYPSFRQAVRPEGQLPPVTYALTFGGGTPPPGSHVSVSRDSLALRVRVEVIRNAPDAVPLSTQFIRIGFHPRTGPACFTLTGPGGEATGDFVVSGPLIANAPCALPVTASVWAELLSPQREVLGRVPLGIAYTLEP